MYSVLRTTGLSMAAIATIITYNLPCLHVPWINNKELLKLEALMDKLKTPVTFLKLAVVEELPTLPPLQQNLMLCNLRLSPLHLQRPYIPLTSQWISSIALCHTQFSLPRSSVSYSFQQWYIEVVTLQCNLKHPGFSEIHYNYQKFEVLTVVASWMWHDAVW